MDITQNHNFEKLARSLNEAQRDFHDGNAKLERTKLHLAEFVMLNKDNIAEIDLSAFHEQCDDARLTIDIATQQFNETKEKMLAFVNGLTINSF